MARARGPLDVYFDFPRAVTLGVNIKRRIDPGFYHINCFTTDSIPRILMYSAVRIWMEKPDEPDHIWVHKNVIAGQGTDLDLREFMWVKLQAKSIA